MTMIKYLFFTSIFFVVLIIIADFFILPAYTKGGPLTKVPNVVGLTLQEGIKILEENNLVGKRGYDYSDSKMQLGSILSQNPLPNSTVKSGRHVYVSVNIEKKVLQPTPNVKNIPLKKARQIIAEKGFVLGSVTEEVATSMKDDGLVIWQSISPYQKVEKGTSINLRVAKLLVEKGEKIATLPDVTGFSYEKAQEILNTAGFMNIKLFSIYSTTITPNTVVAQDPTERQAAPLPTNITLKVTTDRKYGQ